jgi:hypothetical protein
MSNLNGTADSASAQAQTNGHAPEIKIGDTVIWRDHKGQDWPPAKVREVYLDQGYCLVEGSDTGLPLDQVTKVEPRAVPWDPPADHNALIQTIVDYLKLVHEPDDIIELRVLGFVDNPKYPGFIQFGYFDQDHLENLARVALSLTPRAEAVWTTINPTVPDLLARANNRVKRFGKDDKATSDNQIIRRRRLVIDFDPKRLAGISATDAEKALARERMLAVKAELDARGFPEPIIADSGNGYHLHYLIDLPTDDGGLIERVLKAISSRYTDKQVGIDTALSNPSRCIKLYGTLARKGDPTDQRPHRLARVISVPTYHEIVTREMLEALVADWTPTVQTAPSANGTGHDSSHRPGNGKGNGIWATTIGKNGSGAGISYPEPGTTVFDDYDQRASWDDAELIGDWPVHATRTDGEVYRTRPGKGHGTSATIGYEGHDVLHVFTSSAPPFEAHKNYTKVQVYALLNHGGDMADAARALSDRGFGTWIDEGGEEHQNPPPRDWRSKQDQEKSPEERLKDIIAEGEMSFSNWEWEEVEVKGQEGDSESGSDKKTKFVPVGRRMKDIECDLRLIGHKWGNLDAEWPCRVDEVLFVESHDYQPIYLNSASRLFAWINRISPIDWKRGSNFITQEQFFEHERMTALRYDAIETLPHWPPISGIYYMHKAVSPGDGSYLERLLDFFCPATKLDRQFIKSLILTLFWGGSPGQRPGFLITGPDKDQEQGRGVGKSKLCDVISEELGGGYINVLPTDEMKNVVTRLLSTESGRKRVARLDNVKTHRFSWADLEGMITSSVISGHSMYHGEGRRPNTLVWLITLNGASLSKDMAQRVIVIKLGRPRLASKWEDKVRAFCRKHLQELLGDIRGILEQEPYEFDPALRWAAWERDVLSKLDHCLELESEIKERQDAIDDDQDEKQVIIEFFKAKLEEFKHNPDHDAVLIPSATVAEWISLATRKNYATNQASAFLNGLSIINLSKSDRDGKRYWKWTGAQAGTKSPVLFDAWIVSVPGSGGSGGGSGRPGIIAYGKAF